MNREENWQRVSKGESFDLIVIGGGATGAGVAWDAATRGLKVALFEANDFAEGTSSRSTKLVHGGVRYLQSGQVDLVREALRERGNLVQQAEDFVEPLAFLVPAYRWYERFFYGVGLTIYDFLAGKLGIKKTEHWGRQKATEAFPNLKSDGLRGGTLYWDAQFDDARLVIAVLQKASEAGACVINHCRVTDLLKEDDCCIGVEVADESSDERAQVNAKVVVNCTGVFSDEIREKDQADTAGIILSSRGSHIVLDRKFLPGSRAIMIPKTDDGRVLFAIPWKNRLVVGTTDIGEAPITTSPEASEEEITYLIEHAARYLTEKPTREDVKATFAGLRPLVRPADSKGSSAEVSRTHHVEVSPSKLITIAGGKWTTFRQMAEDVVERAIEVGKLTGAGPCRTLGDRIKDRPAASDGGSIHPDLPYQWEDVERAVREEMALTLGDVLSRRLRCTFLDEAASIAVAPEVARRMAEWLGESEEWIADELARFQKR